MKFRSVAALLVSLVLAGCGSGGVTPFELYSPDGAKTYSLNDYKGHVLVRDFWATWCKPCKMVQPVIKGWAEKYSKGGVDFVGVTEEAPKVVSDFIAHSPLGYPALIDRGDTVQAEFKVTSFPTIIIIDRNGAKAFDGSPFETDKVVAVLDHLTNGK